MIYQVILPKTVQKQVNQLPQDLKQRIVTALMGLQEDPRPVNSLQMKGVKAYRLRVGDYRVLYDIDDKEQIVTLRRVGHRREIYRDM